MILAIVQARMSSSRLPGKVLKNILGKPVIGYLFERLKCAKRIDKIILATSINSENDDLCLYIQSLGFDVFRGSEDNVLERYYLSAMKYAANGIVRITGDCPLIDPQLCDRLIDEFLEQKVDYAYLTPMFAEGLDCEVLSYSAVKQCYQNAKLVSECEHVTRYIINHKDQFKIFQLDNSEDDSRYRIVLDEQEDFEALRILFENYYGKLHPRGHFSDIKQYLDTHPELIKMNARVIRNEGIIKSLQNDKVFKPEVAP